MKKNQVKISVNKMSSDLAEILCAARPREPLSVHKISAKSDDILLSKILIQKFEVWRSVPCLFFFCFESCEIKNRSECWKLKFKMECTSIYRIWEVDIVVHHVTQERFYGYMVLTSKNSCFPTYYSHDPERLKKVLNGIFMKYLP